jgi:RNA polymerase sigma factor (sigma-70 family)
MVCPSNMHERAGNQRSVSREPQHQPLLSPQREAAHPQETLPQTEQLLPLSFADTNALPTTQPLSETPTNVLRSPSRRKAASLTTEPLPQFAPRTETPARANSHDPHLSLPSSPSTIPEAEAITPQAKRQTRRSQESKPLTVSLEDAPLLTSDAQYRKDLRDIPLLSPEEEQQVVTKAQHGDQEARNRLIENCLPAVLHFAHRSRVYLKNDDLMDIVGVGNLAITEKLNAALTKENPSAYLYGVARQAISTYCLFRSRLIPIKGHSFPLAESPIVESLDALIEDTGEKPPLQIATPEQSAAPKSDEITSAPLRKALSQLSDQQREVVELRHGLGEATGELPFADIAQEQGVKYDTAKARYTWAIKHLRQFFARPYWAR